ncbi:hypothetical protein BOX15_Mlig005551g4 [Macrostomum lignano]|uniref:Uncharacterized protein n=1 Tax=Macrostomum lignano TaxID=282301 RepID=A0A267GE81_9PLAT|nr:hypothetical protein BOX15_Mlig005551g4 [Macrostomum lignano]
MSSQRILNCALLILSCSFLLMSSQPDLIAATPIELNEEVVGSNPDQTVDNISNEERRKLSMLCVELGCVWNEMRTACSCRSSVSRKRSPPRKPPGIW